MRRSAKLFKNGRSQAVRLPAEFRFDGKEVFVEKAGNRVILRPKPVSWDDFFARQPVVPDDFLGKRRDLPVQRRRLFR